MPPSLVPSAGWTVSHRFYRIDRARWRCLSPDQRTAAVGEARTWLGGALVEEGLQLMPLALIGKRDFGVMAVAYSRLLWLCGRLRPAHPDVLCIHSSHAGPATVMCAMWFSPYTSGLRFS
ncbi:MAG: hypothetical protein HY271_15630 [Deltaproteobacteria bacterium]|nr:hypothetical protein [Deltaproteobacteria bacterium]